MEPFKERINRESIGRLADRFSALPGFDSARFKRAATRGLGPLELKDRVRHVAKVLRGHLDPDYERALVQITSTLEPPLDGTDEVSSGLFIEWPLLQLIEDHASDETVDLEGHFEASFEAMHALTQRFSAEFAVRPFLARDPDRSLRALERFAADPSPHVRRLASEGSRPRLPWGMRLKHFTKDPTQTRRILNILVDDPELYVRRSVANHVNDISKDHPEVALEICARWLARKRLSKIRRERREWMVKHGLRGLIKQGDSRALAAVGFGDAEIEIGKFELTPEKVAWNGSTQLRIELVSVTDRAQPLLIDYAVHLKKADGSLRPKVFKGRELSLDGGGVVRFEKKHSFREVTTRKHYPGEQRFELLVNGESLGIREVELLPPRS